MNYRFFLARRYAFSRKKENFITTISIISMLGILVGTAALVIVLSVFNGFSSVVTNVLVSFDPHLRISRNENDTTATDKTLPNSEALLNKVRENAEVRFAAPVVKEKAVMVHYTLPYVVNLTGIDQQDAERVSGLATSVSEGHLELDSTSIVVGRLLADELAISIGDSIRVYSPTGLERILTEPIMPRSKVLIVRGTFAANNREYDMSNAYTSLGVARYLFDLPAQSATNIEMRLSNIDESNNVKEKLSTTIDTSQYTIASWYDLHTELYTVMQIERWIAYLILFLIVAVASFNIFSSLTLTVFEKQRDIGLLRALGASRLGIRDLYLYQGAMVGLIGTVLGLLLGVLVVWLQQQFGFFPLDSSVYIIPQLPVELRAMDFVTVGLGSLLLSLLGAFIPARRAALVQPAEALRWE